MICCGAKGDGGVKKNFNVVQGNKFLRVAVGLMGTAVMACPSVALAYHHHIAVKGTMNDGTATAACTFPDGTSPDGAPEQHCYGVPDFLAAYGIDQLHAAGITGKGQTIILVDSYGSPTMQADLDHFSDTYNLPHTTIQFIMPNGNPYPNYPTTPMTSDQVGWAEETSLDLEWAHAVAPDATLVNIVSTSSETVGMAGLADLFAGIQTAATQYPGAVLSMSFGAGEGSFQPGDITAQLQGALHAVFQQATNAGITLLASSGDSGSVQMNAAQSSLSSAPDASYPAVDPLVTAVGGTAIEAGWRWNPTGTADDFWNCQLTQNANCPTDFMAYESTPGQTVESIWKEDWNLAAGSGGISKVFSSPTYQANIPAAIAQQANGFRTIPDTAFNAAINGGVSVYMSFVGPGATGANWQAVGGTSCASPETAGLIALAGQKASDTLGKQVSIGQLNPIVYALPATDFNDILPQTYGAQSQVTLQDDSLYFSATLLAAIGATHETPVAVPGYQVLPGFDIATGFGSPKPQFVLDVAAARVAALQNAQLP